MTGSIGLLWSLFKAFKYLVPFLHEASREQDYNDREDVMIAENLRRLIKTVLWKIVSYTIFAVVFFFYVIPLTGENHVLKVELQEEKEERANIEQRFNASIEKYKDETDRIKQELTLAQASIKDITYIREQLGTCREDVTELRVILGNAGKEYLHGKSNTKDPYDTKVTIPISQNPEDLHEALERAKRNDKKEIEKKKPINQRQTVKPKSNNENNTMNKVNSLE